MLAKTIRMHSSLEAAKKHYSDIHAPAPDQGMVASLHQHSQALLQLCSRCGSRIHKEGRRQCPAYKQVCMSCQKFGHFARVCRSRGMHQPTNTEQLSSQPQQPHSSKQGTAIFQGQPGANTIWVQSQNHVLQP